MRWFLGLVLVVALVAGALYGVGRFLLPNDLEVTRTVTIERPRSAVFAMVNDLRIAQEWSPFYARDPDAEYVFSGEPGQGQSMRWRSNVRDIGAGRMSIVSSTDMAEVESILEIGERATLNSQIQLRAVEGGTSAAWAMSAECAEGSVNVPCRYMNLIMRGRIQRELDAGLARLKTLAEQLPNVDFEGLNPEILADVAPQAYAYSVANTSLDPVEIERAQRLCVESVQRFMSEYSLTPAGPLVRVTTNFDQAQQRIEFRVGYPFEGPRPINFANAQVGETPSGPALHVTHVGPRSQVRMTYARIEAYLQAHRIARREDGLPWEIVHYEGGPDDPNPTRIEIFMPLQ
jgi:hypothetical protein